MIANPQTFSVIPLILLPVHQFAMRFDSFHRSVIDVIIVISSNFVAIAFMFIAIAVKLLPQRETAPLTANFTYVNGKLPPLTSNVTRLISPMGRLRDL